MLKILVNSYACCPGMGSEQGMAWNFISRLSKVAEVFVITESEYECENKMVESDHLHFVFVSVGNDENESAKIRAMCWNQGTWSFYPKYKKWQEKALIAAEKIIEEQQIDIMHQLNMAGFREPGMLYKINERRVASGLQKIPLVWGPMTGYGKIPFSFMLPGGVKFTAFYLVKNLLNFIQLIGHHRVRKMVYSADKLIAATPEMKDGIERFYDVNVELINETGVNQDVVKNVNYSKDSSKFKILWVGRFIYTKQLDLALKTVAQIKNLKNVEFHIVGKGFTDLETERFHQIAESLGVQGVCHWYGQIPNQDVLKLMAECDVFFFTSIFEATSTVILEAIQNNLPIVCFDRCGFGPIVDKKIGIKIPCKTPKQAVRDFSASLRYLYENRSLLASMAENCKEKQNLLGWDKKIDRLIDIYTELKERK